MSTARRTIAAMFIATALAGGMALVASSAEAVAPAPVGGQGSEAMVNGSADAFAGPSEGAVVLINPIRVADSRQFVRNEPPRMGEPQDHLISFMPGDTQMLRIAGEGIPTTGVQGFILNVTTTNGPRGGYVTVWPAGDDNQPATSNVNFHPGLDLANEVTVEAGVDNPNGNRSNSVSIFASGRVDVIVDVMGYVTG